MSSRFVVVFLMALSCTTVLHAQESLQGIVPDPCAAESAAKQPNGWEAWHAWLAAHDFGQLCQYRAQDTALAAPKVHDPRVVFMGDSITESWKQIDPGFFIHGRIDRGISGQTTPQMLLRFRQDVIDLHPAAVHIMAATNDVAGNTGASTLETVEGNIASMADLAHAHGIRVILASVPPTNRFPWQPAIKPVPVIVALNAWIRRYAKQHDFVYVDYYDAMATPGGAMKPGLSIDGVHPNARGFAVMEPLTRAAIRKALNAG